jgi:hypothetical protein
VLVARAVEIRPPLPSPFRRRFGSVARGAQRLQVGQFVSAAG